MDWTRLMSSSPLSAVARYWRRGWSRPCSIAKVLEKFAWPSKIRTPTDEPFSVHYAPVCGWPAVTPLRVMVYSRECWKLMVISIDGDLFDPLHHAVDWCAKKLSALGPFSRAAK